MEKTDIIDIRITKLIYGLIRSLKISNNYALLAKNNNNKKKVGRSFFNCLFSIFFFLLLFLFTTVFQMFFYEDFIELFLTIFTSDCHNFLILNIFFSCFITFLLIFLFLLLLHGFYCRPKVLWGSFPILSCLGFVKSFPTSHSHLFLLFYFCLLHDMSLLLGN